jgi:opacity protein-like surface antigen
LRARLGYAIDRTLLFVTGGIAWADYEAKIVSIPVLIGKPQLLDDTLTGWQIRGGIEQALEDNITLRLDYLYTRYDSEGWGEGLPAPLPATRQRDGSRQPHGAARGEFPVQSDLSDHRRSPRRYGGVPPATAFARRSQSLMSLMSSSPR